MLFLRSTLLVRVLGVMAASLPLLLGGVVQAEQPYQVEWTRVFGADYADVGYGVAVDNNGLVYVSGVTGYNDDAFLAQYDTEGNQLWFRKLGTLGDEYSRGLAIDSSGNPIISGFTTGDLAGPNAGNSDAFIAKYDPSGTSQWVRQSGYSGFDSSYAVVADAQGNSYLTWAANPSSYSNYDGYIEKYNANGGIEWSRTFGSPKDDRLYAADLDSQGNLLLAGYTQGVLGSQSMGGADAFVVTYTEDGDLVSSLQFGTSSHEWATGVASDDAGNFYVTGETQGQLGDVSYGSADAFLAKFNSSGVMEWSRQLGTPAADGANAVTVDPLGNIFITGYTYGAFPGETQPYSGDLFLAKYNPSGVLLWIDQYSTGSGADSGLSITSDSVGNIYVSGESDWSGSSGNILLMKYSVPEPASMGVFALMLIACRLGRQSHL